mgnify:CR=1 FL=1
MSALDFDMTPPPEAIPPPTPEVSLEGTEAPPPIPEQETPQQEEKVEMEVSERYDEEELEELELPELPQRKAKLTDDEVFTAPKVKPVVKEKKPRKKRKPMTPEQLERLAEGRKKAFQVKAQKKKERDEMKALQKKVEEKKKARLNQEIMDELSDDEIPETMKRTPKKEKVPLQRTQSIMPSVTQEDLNRAIAQGVEIYDTKRKAQKKVKREQQEKERKQKEVVQKIQKAIDPNSFWDQYLK